MQTQQGKQQIASERMRGGEPPAASSGSSNLPPENWVGASSMRVVYALKAPSAVVAVLPTSVGLVSAAAGVFPFLHQSLQGRGNGAISAWMVLGIAE